MGLTLAEDLLSTLKQNPRGNDVFVFCFGDGTFVRMRETGWRDYHRSFFRSDFRVLIIELCLATALDVV